MKKTHLIPLTLLTLAMNTAFADDQSYYAPQTLKNCKASKDNRPTIQCDLENTFFRISNTHPVTTIPRGDDYHFIGASGYITDSSGQVVYTYINESKTGELLLINDNYQLHPDLNAIENKWAKGTNENQYVCKSSTVADCPFTHTPWKAENSTWVHEALVYTQKPLTFPNHKLKETLELTSKQPSRGKIILKNHTDYPVTFHVDDYNMADIQLISPIVPARSTQTAATYQINNSEDLQIDAQLGFGDRTIENTSVFLVHDNYLLFNDGYTLYVNNKIYVIAPKQLREPDENGDITLEAKLLI